MAHCHPGWRCHPPLLTGPAQFQPVQPHRVLAHTEGSSSLQAACPSSPLICLSASLLFRDKEKRAVCLPGCTLRVPFPTGCYSLLEFTQLLVLRHFTHFGFFCIASNPHFWFGTAEAWAGQRSLFSPSAEQRVLPPACPSRGTGQVTLLKVAPGGWLQCSNRALRLPTPAQTLMPDSCPVLDMFHNIPNNNRLQRENGRGWKATLLLLSLGITWKH